MKKSTTTINAPVAIGPYSQAIQANGFIFISGQIPINPQDGELEQGIFAQTHQVMKNLLAILQAENLDFSHAVKASIFLTDMMDFDQVNTIYASYFTGMIPPARETVQVSKLPKNALIEISLIALTK